MDSVEDLKKEIGSLKNRVKKLEESHALENSPDVLLGKAVEIIKKYSEVSASLLQRRLSIGYSRAARLLDQLEDKGLVGKAEGSYPRKVIRK